MEKQLDKGSFVQDASHPEYGTGRVVMTGTFSTKVLFAKSGMRVYRISDTGKLRTTQAPLGEELQAIVDKESAMASGTLAPPGGANGPPAPAPAKKAARKKKAAT